MRAATRRACEQPPKLPSMSDNVYFMESELCMGTMNDKCVDKLHKKREPKHWNAKHSTTQSVVVARKGVIARVEVKHAHDPNEPLVSGGHALLEGLTPDERRSLLDQAPPRHLLALALASTPTLTPTPTPTPTPDERRSLLDQAPPRAVVRVS